MEGSVLYFLGKTITG